MDSLILSFDIGTQSLKALIVDKVGNTIESEIIKYEVPFISNSFFGQAEQFPDFYYNALCLAATKLKEKAGKVFEQISAVTVATFRDSVTVLDKDNKPLRNFILWMDQRRAPGSVKTSFWKKILFKIVGKTDSLVMAYKYSFYNWIRECEPEIFSKARKFVTVSNYISLKLTGNLADSVASQVGHFPFDGKKRQWSKKSISRCVYDIPMEMLVNVVESGNEIGKINEETSIKSGIPQGLPLLATGTDKVCEALGLSVVSEGKAAISLGTASTIQFCTKKYFSPEPFLPSYPSIIPGRYNAENQVYRGYWTITWFKEQFCDFESLLAKEKNCKVEQILDTYLNEIPVGCNGLIMTPHLSPGVGNPFAKGMFVGITDRHTKKHFYRAIVEGINFELLHAMKRMERRSKTKIQELFVAGGGSICDSIMQITSDMFGLPVKRIQTAEATSIGCAIAGFVGLGEYKSYEDACNNMVHESNVFIPDKENHLIYQRIYNKVYKKLEKTNTGIFKAIKSLE